MYSLENVTPNLPGQRYQRRVTKDGEQLSIVGGDRQVHYAPGVDVLDEIVKIKNINTYEILTNPNNVPQTLNRHQTFEDAFKQVYCDLKNIDEIALHLPPLTPDLLKQCKINHSFYIKDTGERRNNQTHDEME